MGILAKLCRIRRLCGLARRHAALPRAAPRSVRRFLAADPVCHAREGYFVAGAVAGARAVRGPEAGWSLAWAARRVNSSATISCFAIMSCGSSKLSSSGGVSSKIFMAIPTTRHPSGSRRTAQMMFSLA